MMPSVYTEVFHDIKNTQTLGIVETRMWSRTIFLVSLPVSFISFFFPLSGLGDKAFFKTSDYSYLQVQGINSCSIQFIPGTGTVVCKCSTQRLLKVFGFTSLFVVQEYTIFIRSKIGSDESTGLIQIHLETCD